MTDDYEWQDQRIVRERQTSSGLEYEVSVQKMLWLPRAMLDTKLVRKYRAGVPSSDQSPHEMVVTVAESGHLR
jgi:hypothetical protein